MTRMIGAGVRRKLDAARKTYQGGGKTGKDKPALSLATYKRLLRSFQKKGLQGGASGAGWLTPWKWDSDDWKAVGVGLAYGADAVIMGALESKTVKQLIKTAVSTGTSAQLATMGILVPPSVIAMGTDQAIDAFIAGIVMAHDYVVGDNPYRESVDAVFEQADKYAPQIIKGVEVAQSALQTGVTNLLAPTGMGKHSGAKDSALLDVLKNPTKEKLDAEVRKQAEEPSAPVKGGSGMASQLEFFEMSADAYMKRAKANAKKAGYDPRKLSLCHDGVHKLAYDGVEFGRVGYGDHILYSFLEKRGEAPAGTATEKRQAFRKSHRAIKDAGHLSPNQLALKIIWG